MKLYKNKSSKNLNLYAQEKVIINIYKCNC